MQIPKHWAKAQHQGSDRQGQTQVVTAWGWSFDSLQQAREDAAARAKRVFDLFTSGRTPDRYAYHERPIREEILDEIRDDGALIAVVTRNRYGAKILNCVNALFVDVDFKPPPATGLWQRITLAFSPTRRERNRLSAAETRIQEVEQWAERNPGRSFRLYRTKEGLRLLFTDRLYDPSSADTAATLAELDADPLYVELTRHQQCFRARLTAKPWRCGSPKPPTAFPREDPEQEARFRDWERVYARRDAEYRVCELLKAFGTPNRIGALDKIIDLHDRATRIALHAPLA
jgi:hypothetical protein